jgi:hypothetical protein
MQRRSESNEVRNMTSTRISIVSWLQRVLIEGTLGSLLSGLVLARRGRDDTGSALAAVNAPSHWFWGHEALRRNDASARHTLIGALVHHASSVFWAFFYDALQQRRRQVTPANAFADAAAITTLAAVVDLKLVPERLTPGFERRLSKESLLWVYVAFGVGLALGGVLMRQRS